MFAGAAALLGLSAGPDFADAQVTAQQIAPSFPILKRGKLINCSKIQGVTSSVFIRKIFTFCRDSPQLILRLYDVFIMAIVGWVLGVLQQLCFIFRGEPFCFCFELRLSGLVESWRRGRPGCNWYAHLREELFLPGRRADAQ